MNVTFGMFALRERLKSLRIYHIDILAFTAMSHWSNNAREVVALG
jgi:hypothetical protein